MTEKKETKKEYEVINLGTPSYFIFPTMTKLGYKGRPEILVNNGDVIELTDKEAERLLRTNKIKLKKSKGAK